MTDGEIRGLLRELRDEPVPADSMARVRARVERRTAARGWWGWIWVPAVAVVVLVTMVLLWQRPVAVRPMVAQAPPLTAAAVEVKPLVEGPKAAKVARPRQRLPAVSSAAIRIETADPDVVLILVTGGGED